MVTTSVIEGLNIMEVVTADRIVGQVSLQYAKGAPFPRISFAGSRFDGLRVAGRDVVPVMNKKFMTLHCEDEDCLSLKEFRKASREQGRTIIKSAKKLKWVLDRFSWMDSEPKPGEDRCVLCSLVDGVDPNVPGRSFGHVLEIPEFGRIFLGEFTPSCGSVRLSMIRAELGCSIQGNISAGVVGGGGGTFPP